MYLKESYVHALRHIRYHHIFLLPSSPLRLPTQSPRQLLVNALISAILPLLARLSALNLTRFQNIVVRVVVRYSHYHIWSSHQSWPTCTGYRFAKLTPLFLNLKVLNYQLAEILPKYTPPRPFGSFDSKSFPTVSIVATLFSSTASNIWNKLLDHLSSRLLENIPCTTFFSKPPTALSHQPQPSSITSYRHLMRSIAASILLAVSYNSSMEPVSF